MITAAEASALCRKAADHARQLADAASVFAPAPWRAEKGAWNGDWPLDYVANSGGGPRFKAPTEAEAAHIAAWDPSVALAFADVLESAASLLDTLPPGMAMGTQMSLTVRMAEVLLGGGS